MSERDTKKDSRPGGANAPTRADRDETNPTRANVEGVTQAQQDAANDIRPLKPAVPVKTVSASAAAVSKYIEDNNLQVYEVNSENQDKQLEQLSTDNGDGITGLNERGSRNRDTRPQQRMWYSDIPANPNDLLRSNHGTSDAVSG
jgi:hypothetical protein